MTSLNLLGLQGTCFTTSSFVPQVWRTWKSRDVSGISPLSYAVNTAGLARRLAYELLRGDLPLVGDRLAPDDWLAGRRSLNCRVPCDHVPTRSWPLFKARDLMRGVIESFKQERLQ